MDKTVLIALSKECVVCNQPKETIVTDDGDKLFCTNPQCRKSSPNRSSMDAMVERGAKATREVQNEEILRLLDVFNEEPALRHLRSILIENLSILERKDKLYNGEQSVLENCYTDMDATALQNAQQAFVRTKGQCVSNGAMIRDVPLNNLEGKELIQDSNNWFLIWQCCRRAVKGFPAMNDIEQKRIEKQNELRTLPEYKSDTNVNGCDPLSGMQQDG